MPKEIVVRLAQLEDAQSVSELAIRSFRDTFFEGTSAADMEAYIQNDLSVRQFRLELQDSDNIFLVLFLPDASDPAGYAKLRSGTTEDCVTLPNAIELERLYVDTPAIGKGIGSRLMQAALDRAAALGFSGVWLGVWEHNVRAIQFYQRWHFEVVGDHAFVVGSDVQNDLIMERSLQLPSAPNS